MGRHRVTIDADHYLPLGSDMCPTGKIAIVDDTPFDLRSSSRLGTGMVAEHPQIRLVEGYDHYFPINGEGLRRAVRLEAPDDRIAMEVWTTQAGVQFYTANTLLLRRYGKQDKTYSRYDAVCVEPQGYPDASNHPAFPDNELRPGEPYHHVTEYRFEVADRAA